MFIDDDELDAIEKELNDILEQNRLRREKHKIEQAAFEKKLGELQRRSYNLKKELKDLEEKRKKKE
ncbi:MULTISPECIES: hypothetical protein [unclassified Bacillus cereus group]|uniref:hypothetical protein n=1 Tax=unclassified Bacillus cereus group TaxID=2750818 RepID=UPI0029C311A7|nr:MULTISPECIES: hypothetical protein [unclassified Bacillus cereus group]MDX5880814.1 hypothetical protein [Bacillus cereus group sp. BfR-BA-01042]MDX5906670.1 hypothetical protein [Bacillus cereus group sp. BfR-BA-01048]